MMMGEESIALVSWYQISDFSMRQAVKIAIIVAKSNDIK
jgi:hypothetical protein